MNRVIIALSGKLNSGKTTVADALVVHHGFVKKSFAENLRKICGILGGYDHNRSHTTEEKAIFVPGWNMTRGEFLQYIGTDVIRCAYEDAWITTLVTDIKNLDQNIVIDDMRFPNEYEAIKQMGGLCVRLIGNHMDIRANTTRDIHHTSETALDHIPLDEYDFHFKDEPVDDIVDVLRNSWI